MCPGRVEGGLRIDSGEFAGGEASSPLTIFIIIIVVKLSWNFHAALWQLY